MDPEEHQHDQAQAADTIAAARNDEPLQGWRQVSDETDPGGEVWLKENSTTGLAAWSPATEQAPPEAAERQERVEGSGPTDDTERFLTAPEQVRKRIEDIEVGHLPHLAAGRSTVPEPLVKQHRETCSHCEGRGFVPGISDYLRESAALLGDQGDAVVLSFYRRLFTAAPEVAKLFPGDPTKGDLGTDHRGAKQREKLLAAIVALADLYDPDDPEKMDRLDRALKSFGRSHAAFARADGTVRGATWEEYGVVKDALFATLVQATGSAWKAEYTASWSQAYDYAAAVMVAEQHRSGFSLPRFPRA